MAGDGWRVADNVRYGTARDRRSNGGHSLTARPCPWVPPGGTRTVNRKRLIGTRNRARKPPCPRSSKTAR